MKTLVRSVLLAGGLALVTGVSPASAQVYQELTFTTTFPFMVGRTTLPAGSYTVGPVFDGGAAVLEIRGTGGGAMFLSENTGAPRANPEKTEVVFDRSGDHYVLSEIWDAATREGADTVALVTTHQDKSETHHAKR
jgi:hypothetical protein